MATGQTTSGTERARKERPQQTAAQLAHNLQREEPELFKPYDSRALAEALVAGGIPSAVQVEIADFWFRLHRQDFEPTDPAILAERRQRRRTERDAIAEQVEIARTQVVRDGLSAINADFVMSDGRRLGDWTVGELRKVGGVFAFILAKAGDQDDARKIDQVMSARDWKKANA